MTKETSGALLPRAKVAKDRYGRSVKTLDRWSKDPELQFPAPVDIRGFKYFREADLIAWDRSRSIPSSKIHATEAAKTAHLARMANNKTAAKAPAETSEPE
jgi:hypothetical protein